MKANTFNRPAFSFFETSRQLHREVIGLLDGDFPERVQNTQRCTTASWIFIISPSLAYSVGLNLWS
jgi:hypothetical protein